MIAFPGAFATAPPYPAPGAGPRVNACAPPRSL
jgi:hypothetical protein